MDERVLQTQQWLNATYSGRTGYINITEDGQTGQGTFLALIRALQIELGGILVDGDFGTSTLNACPVTISQVPNPDTAAPNNLHYIIQGSLWCKGYNPGGFTGVFGPSTATAIRNFQSDAGITQDGIIRPYILQAIMNTDGYALAPGGDTYIRQVQTGLNSLYGATIGLSPSNGIWERKAHRNLIKAAQIEWGATPADGVFGDGTISKAPTLSQNTSGYTASKRILQWALCINGYYPGGFTGTFGTGTYNAVYNFQAFASLGADGIAGRRTWASLMRSSGDTTRPAAACDCAAILTAAKAATLVSNSYEVVGRYLTGTVGGATSKALTSSEIQIIFDAGMRFFPIYQSGGAGNAYFTYAQGSYDARAAISAAENLGIPENAIIYFAVDYDALDVQVTSNILPYFSSIHAYFSGYTTKGYRIGIYGARNVCTRVSDAGFAVSSFVSDMSTGFSGNLGYKLPSNWAFDQFHNTTIGSGNGQIEIDRNAKSGRYEGISYVSKSATTPAPDITVPSQPTAVISADPVNTSTGAHLLHIQALKVAGAQDLFFDISYDSTFLSLGTMGRGWSHNYEIKVTPVYDSYYVYWTPSTFSEFTLNSDGTYSCGDLGKQNDIFTINSDGSYSLNRNNDIIYIFNRLGRLTNIQNRIGMNITVSEDESDNLIISETISGKSLTIHYDTAGYVSSVSDQSGRKVSFTYDAKACMTAFTDANGNINTYTYDSLGRVITGTDGEGILCFTNTYDDLGRISIQADSLQNTTSFHYDETSVIDRFIVTVKNRNGDSRINEFDNTTRQLLSETDENNNKTTYTYDSNGNLASTTDALGNTETIVYNSRNHPLVKTDRAGRITEKTYDNAGNLLTVLHPDGGLLSYAYDSNNRVVNMTDSRGTVAIFIYDTDGLLIKKTIGEQNYRYTYNNGLIVSEQNPNGGMTYYAYDEAGRIISQTDANGFETIYIYDALGNKLSKTDPKGYVTAATYNCRGEILTQTDGNTNVTTYSYNGNGKLITKADPKSNGTTYTYDKEDRQISIEDALGNITKTEYDATGRIRSITDAYNKVTAFTYDAVGNILTTTEPGGGVTSNTYNAVGLPITKTDSAGSTSVFGYDLGWRLNSVTDVLGKVTEYQYDTVGNLLSVTDPLGNVTTYTYDAYGNILSVTDPNSNITTLAYDANNNKIRRTDPLGNVTIYIYDAMNRLIQIQDANGHVTTNEYDANGRVIGESDALGNRISMSYDPNGNLLTKTDAFGQIISRTAYDATNLPTAVEDVFGNQTEHLYNSIGALVQVEDPLGNQTLYDYDAMGRFSSATDALNGISSAVYDADGNQTGVVFTMGGGFNRSYDASDRLISETTPSGGTIGYEYNETNLLSNMTNARSQSRTFTYDAAGRIISYADTEGTTSFTYDAKGNLLTITDTSGTVIREYDSLNRIIKYTDVNGNQIQYTYDVVGNISSIIYPDTKKVAYTYDEANRLITVTDWAERVTSYTYDANGRLLTTTRPDGSVLAQVYDNAGRLISAIDKDAGGTTISGFRYTYDEGGRIIKESLASGQETAYISYDALGRLINKENKDSIGNTLNSYAYTYDADGNMTLGVSQQQSAAMTYDINDRLLQYNGQNTVFDPDGNMTSCLIDGNITSLLYDSSNRLIQVGNTMYEYDPEGNRISTREGTETTHHVYDNVSDKMNRLLVRVDPEGNHIYYVFGIGLLGHEDAAGYRVYHYDLRGSTIALTNLSGTVTDRYTYGAYGEFLNHVGNSNTSFLYCGQYGVMTDTNGLHYMRTRFYSPEIKRFLNADTKKGSIYDSRTLNIYMYANGNPISYIDPDGMVVWFVAAAAVGAVVGLASTFATDVIANVMTRGEAGFSSWQTYAGNTLGGAVGGVTTVLTGGAAGGAIEGLVSEAVTQGLTILTGEDEDGNIDLVPILSSMALGASFAKFGDIKIKGVNVERYSDDSIYRGVLTKGLRYGTNTSIKTMWRGIKANMPNYETIYDAIVRISEDPTEKQPTYLYK